MLSNIFKHLHLVCRHKWNVFKLCCRAGIPLQGITHDLSKFSSTEFWESVKYYNGKRSPLAVSREINGYSKAWLHHKGRNKHHWEYWIDGYNQGGYGCIMPFKYACEMICDMIAATKVYNGKDFTTRGPLEYFERQTYGQFVHPQIQNFMRAVFTSYVEEGDAMITKQRLSALYQEHLFSSKNVANRYISDTEGNSRFFAIIQLHSLPEYVNIIKSIFFYIYLIQILFCILYSIQGNSLLKATTVPIRKFMLYFTFSAGVFCKVTPDN